jgi:hypothetical protein
MKDPVARIAEIKANDPRRRALIEIFDIWWHKHGAAPLKATDLNADVLEVIDTRAIGKADGSLQYSRQRVAGFLVQSKETMVGGYSLTTVLIGPPSKQVAHYKLTQVKTPAEEALP